MTRAEVKTRDLRRFSEYIIPPVVPCERAVMDFERKMVSGKEYAREVLISGIP